MIGSSCYPGVLATRQWIPYGNEGGDPLSGKELYLPEQACKGLISGFSSKWIALQWLRRYQVGFP